MLSVYPAFMKSRGMRFPLVFFVRYIGDSFVSLAPIDEINLAALDLETVFIEEVVDDFIFIIPVGIWRVL